MGDVAMLPERRFGWLLGLLLLAGLAVRTGYVIAQPGFDPAFDAPILDGAYYLDWARALAAGRAGHQGAFYLAPLYPLMLSLWLDITGGSFAVLYLTQHVLTLATAALLGLIGRRIAGPAAGLSAAALLLLYGPALFFASLPLGETAAMLLLVAALWLLVAPAPQRAEARCAGAGLLTGIASLARPNLLAVGGLWAAGEAWSRRFRRALWVAVGLLLALLPTTLRNLNASGHLVPVSGNMGITLLHGNGPGAAGVYTPPWNFGGALASLREEATMQARLESGRELDAVEADRWWARQAVRTRLADPAGSALLLVRKLGFLVADHELGLDYDPGLDDNPWRHGAPLPFAALLGLAVAALVLPGPSRAGRWRVWSAIVASAATPLIFYVSSRYRLPLAILLCLPAGWALAALIGARPVRSTARRLTALGIGLLTAVASLAIPTGMVGEELTAGALANRADSWLARGEPRTAERELRRALSFDPQRVRMASVWPLYNLGVALEAQARDAEAEEAYRQALTIDSSHVESAANLAALLIRDGRAAEVVDDLRTALAQRPGHAPAWTNLIVALVELDDMPGARSVAREAAALGIDVEPALLERIGLAPARAP